MTRTGKIAPLLLSVLLLGGCAGEARRRDGTILRVDETWRGKVEIRGVLLVERGAHLRIEPGTEVVFLDVDADSDGIGDGQLNVLGRLTARGTAESPILFRAETPRKKGWTFLHLSGNEDSRLEFCIFRDAFTGVQLHYIRAQVSNCLFLENHEGMRYSTIGGEISRNTFADNTVGLRFEGRRSQVTVTRNEFRDNDIAVFPVTRGSLEDRFRLNNFSSRDYSVKLGFEQSDDLDFSENWWGTADPAAVLDSIFDGRADGALGLVRIEPILRRPVEDAGAPIPAAPIVSPGRR